MMLGVHRASITLIAGILQRVALIRYAGGTIPVLDRDGLAASSCECTEALQRRYVRLLSRWKP